MLTICRHVAMLFACMGVLAPALRAAPATLPEALRGVNPDMLSGGVFAALEAAGAFGTPPAQRPPRALASYPDLSKGRPPAVLDARVGTNVRLGDDPDALPATQRGQSEPHIVRSVANPDLLLATFQEGRFFDAGAIDCGYAVSRDGGFTWTRGLTPNLTSASGGRFNRATDPVAGAGPQGDLYLQALASVRGAFELAAVVVSRSIDNGVSWSAPMTVFESTSSQLFPDKNWLAVNDYAGAPNSGRLVSTWTAFNRNAAGVTTSSPLVASVSDDRGTTWSAPSEITPLGSSNQGTQPVFLPDGSLAVVYVSFLNPNNVSLFSIHCKRSADGGRTFPGAFATVAAAVAGWDDPELRDGLFLPSATVARQSGDIFVTWVALVNGTPRVLVAKSTDQGTTWSTPIAASDQPPGISVMNPTITASPDGRTVSVFFADKRHAPNGRGFVDHSVAFSFDGGASWQPNVRVTEMSSDLRFGAQTSRGVMLGDYYGIAPSLAADQPCVAIWCDTRTGNSDPWTARIVPDARTNIFAWNVARFPRGIATFFDDPDRDGISNFWEYVFGSNPNDANSGQTLSLLKSGPGALDVVWAQREVVSGTSYAVAAALNDNISRLTGQLQFTAAPFLLAGVPLTADQLPSSKPTDGLVWRGNRFSFPAGSLVGTVRALTVTTGVGLLAEGAPQLSNTDSRVINLSTRGRTGADVKQMIVGFVLDGNKSMLVRAAGPALVDQGVGAAFADPRLVLSAPASDLVRTNDNWQQSTGGATAALFARVGAFPFANNSLDAALALDLGAQNYTAVVTASDNADGIVLVEAYDADANPGAPGNPRLINLSTRGEVGAGENALIGGFVVTGTQPRRVLIRAIGPSLEKFNLTGVLPDPVLALFQGNREIGRNDDWEISPSGAAIVATGQRVGAFPLNAASLDAALLVTLAPGAYTAIISSANGATGLALVEVYDAD